MRPSSCVHVPRPPEVEELNAAVVAALQCCPRPPRRSRCSRAWSRTTSSAARRARVFTGGKAASASASEHALRWTFFFVSHNQGEGVGAATAVRAGLAVISACGRCAMPPHLRQAKPCRAGRVRGRARTSKRVPRPRTPIGPRRGGRGRRWRTAGTVGPACSPGTSSRLAPRRVAGV